MSIPMWVVLWGAACAAPGAWETEGDAPLPVSVAEDVSIDPGEADALPEDPKSSSVFSIGPAAGYLRVRGADRGTWFGGVQARLRLAEILALEGSITFHQDEFEGGDVEVTQYPVQVTALLYPFPLSPLKPYGLIGAGWYYTRFDYEGVQAVLNDDETDRLFGLHVGAGAELELGPAVALQADFRWIFLDEPSVDNSDIEEEEFDYWQVSLGLGLKF